jgi:hypothetical protein
MGGPAGEGPGWACLAAWAGAAGHHTRKTDERGGPDWPISLDA